MENNPVKIAWWQLAKIYRDTVSFYKEALQAKLVSGTGVVMQVVEIVALRFGRGKLKRQEYYDYALYNKRDFLWRDKQRFFGKAMENRLVDVLKMDRWGIIAHDKCLFNTVYQHMGLPVPAIYGVYQEHKVCTNAPLCSNREELTGFLREVIEYPFISKPIYGIYSRNVTAIKSFNTDANEFLLTNGESAGFDSYVDSVCQHDKGSIHSSHGYLFQELLRSHPDVVEVCGDRICSVRVVVLVQENGPEIFCALWKISSGKNMADNYWRPGNMIAAIDVESGTIQEAIQGKGHSRRKVAVHPDTGVVFQGVRLPDWDKAVALCLEASAVVPGLPMQAWDVALTDRGPVLMEVNLVGGMYLPQITMNTGIYDEKLSSFLATYGFK